MKRIYLVLFTVVSVVISSATFAANGGSGNSSGSGYGGGSVKPGPEFATPRGYGEEASQDEDKEHERKFNEAAPGAWSKDPEPGKDKPSPDK